MFSPNDAAQIAIRFWPKVTKRANNQCWEWVGAKGKAGYGIMAVQRGMNRLAHRVSFCLANGASALQRGKHIAHTCHNRACVNPSHLVQITAGENVMQSRVAGRTARGTKYKNAKLTDEAVREIRRVAKNLDGECEMMKKYRISQTTAQFVFRRRSWQHVVD